MGQIQTASIAEAKKLVTLRAILQMPVHGIYGQLSNGQIIPDEEFVRGQEPPILLIKVVDRETPEDSPSIEAADDYVNVGTTLDNLKRSPHVDAAIKRMIAVENVGISDSAIDNRLMNLPGVQSAWRTAIRKALDEL